MEITKYKKLKNGKYKLIYEDGELIVYEDVILKNNLLFDKKLNVKKIEAIMKDNIYYEAYSLALKCISIRLKTEKQLKEYLLKKEFDGLIIDKVIKELKEKGYLSQNVYVSAYVNDKINLSNDGPLKIKKDLIKFGIDEDLIVNYLFNIDNDFWNNRIKKLIDKKVKLNNKMSLNMFKRKMSNDLFLLGYESEMINECLLYVSFDDTDAYKKEYEKAKKKFSKKYKDNALEYHINSYLISKGFNIYEK